MKRLLFLVMMALPLAITHAQSAYKGILLNEKGEPIFGANVIQLTLPDSTMVKGAISDDKGHFELPDNAQGKPSVLKITHLEYKEKVLTPSSNDLGTISLQKSVNELGEVVVSAHRPVMKQQGTVITADVAASSLKNIPKVDLLLYFLPGVSMSYTSYGVEVFGKGKPLFYINNKRVHDMNDVYRLSPKEIDRISLETQPGAEYDNSVGAVIHIFLKKKQGDGLSGGVSVESRFKKGQEGFVDAHLNYRSGNTDVFFSTHTDVYHNFKRENDQELNVHTQANNWQVRTDEIVKDNTRRFYAKTGFSHEINDKHSLGASVWMTTSPLSGHNVTEQNTSTYRNGTLTQQGLNTFDRLNKDTRLNANVYYDGKLSDKLKLQTDVFYTGAFSNYRSDIVERNLTTPSQRNINTHSDAQSHLWTMKTNLTQRVGKGLLGYGVEASTLSRYDNYKDNISTPTDIDNKETQSAVFASYSFPWLKAKWKIGARYEYTDFGYFENDVKNDAKSRSYKHLLPNISVAFPWHKTEWSFSYAKKITRPAFYELSDRFTYETPFLYNRGNTDLQPRLSDDFSLLLTYQIVSLSVDYSLVHNGFFEDYQLSRTLPNVVERYIHNFGDYQRLRLELSAYYQIGRWVPKLNLMYGKQFANGVFENNQPVFVANLMNQFSLSDNANLFLMMMYRSKGSKDTAYGYKPQGMVILMFSHSFLNKSLEVYGGVMDIFNQMGTYDRFQNPYVTNNKHFDSNTRSFRIGLEYNFNATQSKYKGQQADGDQKNRM